MTEADTRLHTSVTTIVAVGHDEPFLSMFLMSAGLPGSVFGHFVAALCPSSQTGGALARLRRPLSPLQHSTGHFK